MIGAWSLESSRALAVLGRSPRVTAAVFTGAELESLLREPFNPLACAVHWTVKEATLRALALPPRLWSRWRDVRVEGSGSRPRVRLHGEVAAYAAARGVRRVDVTVRHQDSRLIATVVAGGGAARAVRMMPSFPGAVRGESR
ncbi:holo-[acyl-carrier protein] synthase [Actinoplanes octamycinicus]|uniref:Holo-[acyl-carrier protein] synthase n=1 Tax=Actinoplanes octamycinicus TaxID=135948 RepID=A0A7W7GVN0_9ACTN|nr:4'-phosphopantetheinyl transferase superfamily protein [Actinoplanes octamycinicus]MBB4739154.1 holo-[acyl-carrier protein] synthase [Actinoplanes octamycinicus]GIE58871.1 hypothetical protein Aoc01nite_42730 [Actinoplanes octamycinicus]